MFRLGLKYSPYISLTLPGLWITDGCSYIFTLSLLDFNTLPSTQKVQSVVLNSNQKTARNYSLIFKKKDLVYKTHNNIFTKRMSNFGMIQPKRTNPQFTENI